MIILLKLLGAFSVLTYLSTSFIVL